MATERAPGPFAVKPAEALVADTEGDKQKLKRVVGALDLTALGLGGIIGTGIFVIIGEAIGMTGPSVILSFALAGITCAFSALAYAELASAVPVAGSAYTYSYATLGELAAWVIGWDLILEYGVSVAAIAVGWGGYLNELLDSAFSISLPDAITLPPGEGGTFNLTAVIVVVAVGALLIAGFKQSARTNTVMVAIKVVILLIFIALGLTAFSSDNLSPFATHGFNGVVDGAALIFFAYIGFDAISTSSEESKKPSRDLPIAIIASLAIATVLYIAVSIVAVGALPADQLDGSKAPLADALTKGADLSWAGNLISVGALIAITSVVLTILYGQTRVTFSMSRDGLLPRIFSRVNERTRTPIVTTALMAGLIAILAALVPLKEIAELINIGTLFAFLVVNIGVIVLRRTKPDLDRGFRVPLVPVVPIIGGALCIYLMTRLPGETWLRFGVWLLAGLVIYAFFGRRHSRLQRGEDQVPAG